MSRPALSVYRAKRDFAKTAEPSGLCEHLPALELFLGTEPGAIIQCAVNPEKGSIRLAIRVHVNLNALDVFLEGANCVWPWSGRSNQAPGEWQIHSEEGQQQN